MNVEMGIAGLILSAAITPGPNNLMVLQQAGARGVKSALPAIAGIMAGGLVLIAMARIGLNAVTSFYPGLEDAFVVAGAVYLGALGLRLVYRSFKVMTVQSGSVPVAPLGAPALFIFQFANPKAWVLVLTVSAAAGDAASAQISIPLLFVGISGASLLAWAVMGHAAARILQSELARRRFDRVLGLLLIASAGFLALGNI